MTATPEVQQHMEMLRCRSLDKLCEEERLRRLSERMRRDPAESAEPARELRAQQTSTVARQALANSSDDEVPAVEQNPEGCAKPVEENTHGYESGCGKIIATRRASAVQALEDQLEQRRHTTLLQQIGVAGERNNCPSLLAPTLAKRQQTAPQVQPPPQIAQALQQPPHAPRGRPRGPASPVGKPRALQTSPSGSASARPSVSAGSTPLRGGGATPMISPTARTRNILAQSNPRIGTMISGSPRQVRNSSTPTLVAPSLSAPFSIPPATPTMRPRRSTGSNSPFSSVGSVTRSRTLENMREKLEEVKRDVHKVKSMERSTRWDMQREEKRHTETTRSVENRNLMDWRSQQAIGLRAEADRVMKEAKTGEQADSRAYQTFVRDTKQATKEQDVERSALELCERLDQATWNLEVQRASFLKAQMMLEEKAQGVLDLRDIRADQQAQEQNQISQDREHELELNMALKVKNIFTERSRLEKSLNHMNSRRQANPLKIATARKSTSSSMLK